MSETTSASPKKAAAASKPAKKARTTPNHPKVSEMVNAAISNLKERGGSSLQAIKKYIGANYSVDVEKIAPFIRKYLKTAVTNGTLIQTKGKGASGSFKLGSAGKKTTADKDAVAVKKPVDKKPSAVKAKEAKSASKMAKAKSPSKSMAKKSPSKGAKKASKEKVKKTPTKAKTPKPKKAASKSSAKSAAAPKQESTTAQAD